MSIEPDTLREAVHELSEEIDIEANSHLNEYASGMRLARSMMEEKLIKLAAEEEEE